MTEDIRVIRKETGETKFMARAAAIITGASRGIGAAVAEYDNGPYKSFADDAMKGFASIVPPDADAAAVGEAIVKIVDAPFGKRPFRVHVDPTQDGAEVVNMVSDRVRAELLRRIGLVSRLGNLFSRKESKSRRKM